MSSRSKSKGNRFEREIAKFLTEQFNKPFERVPNSGAFTGGKNDFRKEKLDRNQTALFLGDIIPPSDMNLVIECKNYEKITGGLFSIFEGNSKNIEKWLTELRHDASDNQFHMLFLKLTRIGVLFFVPWIKDFDFNYVKYYDQNNILYQGFSIDKFSNLKDEIIKRC